MILELNIGLHVQRPDADNSETAATVRATRAMRLLAETGVLAHVFGRIQPVAYEHEGEQVVERALIVRAAVRRGPEFARLVLDPMLKHIATVLEQDCIAVRWVEEDGTSRGTLIGPKAAEWGAFDPAFFTPYDTEQEQAA